MRLRLLAPAILLALPPGALPLGAQRVPVSVAPASRVWLEGSTTLDRFTCRASEFDATVESVDTAATAAAAATAQLAAPAARRRVTLTIPVQRLGCGHRKMDDDMRRALRSDANPEIRFRTTGYEIARDGTSHATITVQGSLSIAGRDRPATIVVDATARPDGGAELAGAYATRMTDFGVKPPSALLGVIQARDDIVVHFDIVLTADQVAAAGR